MAASAARKLDRHYEPRDHLRRQGGTLVTQCRYGKRPHFTVSTTANGKANGLLSETVDVLARASSCDYAIVVLVDPPVRAVLHKERRHESPDRAGQQIRHNRHPDVMQRGRDISGAGRLRLQRPRSGQTGYSTVTLSRDEQHNGGEACRSGI